MHALTNNDREALREAWIAHMRAALKLTTAQEKHWTAMEKTLNEVAKTRTERRAKLWQAQSRPDMLARLRRKAKILRFVADQAEQIAKAAEPLVASLDEGQARRFAFVLSKPSRKRAGRRQWAKLTGHIQRQAAQK